MELTQTLMAIDAVPFTGGLNRQHRWTVRLKSGHYDSGRHDGSRGEMMRGSRPGLARPQAEANLAGYGADIDRARTRDMEAAGVEHEIDDLSTVFH
jgi:hypothetical protein